MNNNTVRLGLAVIAAFYVVIGGLWATEYFPLQEFYHQIEVKDAVVERLGYPEAFNTKAFKDAATYQQTYVAAHPDMLKTLAKLGLYKSLLTWATVAFAVAGGVLFATRRDRRAKSIADSPK